MAKMASEDPIAASPTPESETIDVPAPDITPETAPDCANNCVLKDGYCQTCARFVGE